MFKFKKCKLYTHTLVAVDTGGAPAVPSNGGWAKKFGEGVSYVPATVQFRQCMEESGRPVSSL